MILSCITQVYLDQLNEDAAPKTGMCSSPSPSTN